MTNKNTNKLKFTTMKAITKLENASNNTNAATTTATKKVTELQQQKRDLTTTCKEACKGMREYQTQLNVIVNQINEYAKEEGNKAREFFAKCNISIAPRDAKKRDAKRVYLNVNIVLEAFNSLGLIADNDTIKLYNLDVTEGTILRKYTDKETKITTLVADTNITATKVLNTLCRAQKKVLESVAKQKQLQRVAEKNASKKATKATKETKTVKQAA